MLKSSKMIANDIRYIISFGSKIQYVLNFHAPTIYITSQINKINSRKIQIQILHMPPVFNNFLTLESYFLTPSVFESIPLLTLSSILS